MNEWALAVVVADAVPAMPSSDCWCRKERHAREDAAATTSNGMTTSAASRAFGRETAARQSLSRRLREARLGLAAGAVAVVDVDRTAGSRWCCNARGEFSTAGKPVGRRFGHRPGQHRIQPSQLRATLLERWWRGHAMFGDHHRGIGIDIGRRAGQQVKCGAGQRVLIGAPVERLTLQLLGRRVGHRAHRHVRLRSAPICHRCGERFRSRPEKFAVIADPARYWPA